MVELGTKTNQMYIKDTHIQKQIMFVAVYRNTKAKCTALIFNET